MELTRHPFIDDESLEPSLLGLNRACQTGRPGSDDNHVRRRLGPGMWLRARQRVGCVSGRSSGVQNLRFGNGFGNLFYRQEDESLCRTD